MRLLYPTHPRISVRSNQQHCGPFGAPVLHARVPLTHGNRTPKKTIRSQVWTTYGRKWTESRQKRFDKVNILRLRYCWSHFQINNNNLSNYIVQLDIRKLKNPTPHILTYRPPYTYAHSTQPTRASVCKRISSIVGHLGPQFCTRAYPSRKAKGHRKRR